MKLLKRNLVEFEYLAHTGNETDIDPETGLHTGEYVPERAEPVIYEGNISTANLLLNQTLYGQDVRYTHTLLMDDLDADIHESGMIRYNGDLYEIRGIHPSLNVLSIALRKLTKDHAETEEDDGA